MDSEREQKIINEAREYLAEIAMELEAAAQGARIASDINTDQQEAWAQLQQMYSRLEQATLLASRFQRAINDAIRDTKS